MAAFDFPNSPSVNDQYTANGVTFKWNGTIWQRISASSGAQGTTGSTGPTGAQGAAAGLTISTSAPGSPSAGDMWWDSDAGLFLTYYNDGNSSQWVEINQGPKGAQGATGPTGAQGSTGAQGATAAQGAQGATGSTGAQGSGTGTADRITEGNSYAEILDTGTNGIFRFLPEGGEVMRISTDGKMGLGTNNPGQLIHTHSGSSSGGLLIQSNGSTNYIAAIQTAGNFINGSTAGGLAIRSGNGIEFSGNDGSSVQMRLDSSSGNLTIGGSLVVSSGKGIDFSATTDYGTSTPAELLDDYEEGQFSPDFSVASGSITRLTTRGEYCKVGRVVHCMFSISANGSSNPSGTVTITGLPFTGEVPSANGPRGGGGVVFAGYHAPPTLSKCIAHGNTLYLMLDDNSYLQANTSGTGFGYNAYQISGFFSYLTAT